MDRGNPLIQKQINKVARQDADKSGKIRQPRPTKMTAQMAAPSEVDCQGVLTFIFLLSYIPPVEWEVEFTSEFEEWWNRLDEAEQEDVNAKVILLQRYGPMLRRPHSDVVASSKHPNMKEFIIQHAGRPYRVLYAFDPRRCAILLIGGDKTGDDMWYERTVPLADPLYDEHLAALRREGLIDG